MPKAQQSRKKKKEKKPSPYYAVANGAEGSAIYSTWDEAEPMSQGHPEAHCKGCSSAADLIDFFGQWRVDVASVQWKSDLSPLDLSGNAPPQPAEGSVIVRNGGRVAARAEHKRLYPPAYFRTLNAEKDEAKSRRASAFFARPPAANEPIRPPAAEGTGAANVREETPVSAVPPARAPPQTNLASFSPEILSALLGLASAHSLDDLAAALASSRDTAPAASAPGSTASHRTEDARHADTTPQGESSSSASTASHRIEDPHRTRTTPPVGELNAAQLAATLRHVRDLLDGTLLALGDATRASGRVRSDCPE